jgi:hypothetical protein
MLYQGRPYFALKLDELLYIQDMFYIVQNQQILYIHAMPDVITDVTVAQSSATYIEPPMNASKHVLYPQLFEELKSILIF